MDDFSPTEITVKDIEKMLGIFMESEIKKSKCHSCYEEFLPSYSQVWCDECYFSRFPKEEREAFYRSFFE